MLILSFVFSMQLQMNVYRFDISLYSAPSTFQLTLCFRFTNIEFALLAYAEQFSICILFAFDSNFAAFKSMQIYVCMYVYINLIALVF